MFAFQPRPSRNGRQVSEAHDLDKAAAEAKEAAAKHQGEYVRALIPLTFEVGLDIHMAGVDS